MILSGQNGGEDEMQQNANVIESTLTGQGLSVYKIHAEEAVILASNPLNYVYGDRIVSGDVNGDGQEELIFADCNNVIYTLNSSGGEITHFHRDFETGDALATGDVDSDNVDEILIGTVMTTSIFII